MFITKTIEIRFDIKDTNAIFCSSYDETLLRLIRERFNGHCYKSAYILNIERIIRRSNINCKNAVLDGSFYVDILFEASCLIYEKDEILQKCKIIQINNVIMHAKSDYASLQIKNNTKFDIFKEGDVIPVIIKMVRYNLFDTEIAVSATPFIPIVKDLIFFRIGTSAEAKEATISTSDTERNIAVLEQDIKEYEKRLKKCSNSVVKFFKELIYPMSKYVTYTKIHKCKKYDFVSAKDTAGNINVNDTVFIGEQYLDENYYYILDADQKNQKDQKEKRENKNVLEISKDKFILHCLEERKKKLNTLLEFSEIYKDSAAIKKLAPVWKMYNLLKQQL